MEGQEDRIRIPVYGNSVFDSGLAVNDFSQRGLREQSINCLLSLEVMAKRNSITKAQRELSFIMTASTGVTTSIAYIDSAQSLSMVNRKLFHQGKCYGISDIQFYYTPSDLHDTLVIAAGTMGDTWSVHNAWVKGKALHSEMQDLVLEDNPSVEGTWSDFKIFLDKEHRTNTIPGGSPGNLLPIAFNSVYLPGEWEYTQYVLPQHEVDPATGLPLPADETYAHMLGPDLLAGTEWQSVGLINAYQESRSTVFPNSPRTPAGMSESFFNKLTDSGSQEPELADVIEAENDNPPYDLLNYPGGSVNGVGAVITSFDAANVASPNGILPGFLAQCGLIQLSCTAYLNGEQVASPQILVKVAYAPGHYKGVAAIDMGQ